MKKTVYILLTSFIGIMLVEGCLWALNTAQVSGSISGLYISSAQSFDSKSILVDNFLDGDYQQNLLGGQGECWGNSGGAITCTVQSTGVNKKALAMQYDVSAPGSYSLYSSELISLNLNAINTVWVTITGTQGAEPIYIEIKDCESHFPKEPVSDYLPHGIITSTWSAAAIPLTAFNDQIDNWTCIDRLNVMAHSEIQSGQGEIYINDIRLLPERVLIDDFNDTEPENELGGASGFWPDDGTDKIIYDYIDDVLELDYDVTMSSTAEAGYWTGLQRTNLLAQKDILMFDVYSQNGTEDMVVQLKDCLVDGQQRQANIKVSDYYLSNKIGTTKRTVAIPLDAFADNVDRQCIETISFNFSAYPWFDSGTGEVFVDDIILAPSPHPVPMIIDHFADCNKYNALISEWNLNITKTATISATPHLDYDYDDYGCGYGITYAVTGTSSAWVSTGLRGIDVSDYTHLRFFLKGATGNESMHIRLVDADGDGTEYYVPVEATSQWRKVLIPLSDLPSNIDLDKLSELSIAFEWRFMSGEVYIDGLSFTTLENYLPIVMKDSGETCLDYTPSCSAQFNNYEPNNYICSTEAELLSGQPIQSYICSADDRSDYYYINVTTPNLINVSLTDLPYGIDYDLYLYFNGSIVDKSDEYGNANEAISFQPNELGEYYIRVYPYSGYSLSPYTLQVNYQ